MNIKGLDSTVDNFIPPVGFSTFFSEWKKEQTRIGFNWSLKSEELFRKAMLTGMVFAKSTETKSEEAPQKEKALSGTETGRVRSRQESKEDAPVRSRKEVGNTETSDTIVPSNRTRTRTRASN